MMRLNQYMLSQEAKNFLDLLVDKLEDQCEEKERKKQFGKKIPLKVKESTDKYNHKE